MRFLLALIALFAAAPALAQQTPPPVPGAPPARPGQPPATIVAEPVAMMIAAFDADGDAKVTRAEFDAGVRRSFESIDTGKTGAIGYIRFADWAERWLGNRNALPDPYEIDRNDDNRITADELLDRFALLFTRFDGDKDGVIIRSELLTMRAPQFQDGDRRRRREP